MLPQEDYRTACFGFYKNKNSVVSICLHWESGDGITEICVLIKQIAAASGSICKTDQHRFLRGWRDLKIDLTCFSKMMFHFINLLIDQKIIN